MKEKYEKSPATNIRVIMTIQDSKDIKTSELWISKEMLEDVYREQGLTAFRRKIRDSLAEQTNWATFAIHDVFGFIGGGPRPKKSWWRRVLGG